MTKLLCKNVFDCICRRFVLYLSCVYTVLKLGLCGGVSSCVCVPIVCVRHCVSILLTLCVLEFCVCARSGCVYVY